MKRCLRLHRLISFFLAAMWSMLSMRIEAQTTGNQSPPRQPRPQSVKSSGATEPGQPSSSIGVSVKPRSPSSETKSNDFSNRLVGLGLDLGSNATYGNGLRFNLDLLRFIGVEAGAGYNTTGGKVGAGGVLVLPLASRFMLRFGAAVVHSFGTKSRVSVEGKFTPEGGQEETINASRQARVSPGRYYSVTAGSHIGILPAVWFTIHANYNRLIKGHEVEFDDIVVYDQPIDASNERDVENDFNQKAREKLALNGLGFSVGLALKI